MSFSDGGSIAKAAGGPLLKVGSAVAIGGALITGSIKSYENVPHGHVGLRARGQRLKAREGEWLTRRDPGELYGLVREGPHFHPPIFGSIVEISTQDRNSVLERFHVVGKNERKQAVDAQLTWGVVKEKDDNGEVIPRHIEYGELVFRAITAAMNGDELSQSVRAVSGEALRMVMRDKPEPAEFTGEDLLPEVQHRCGSLLLERYGAEIRGLQILDTAPTEADTIVNGKAPNSLPSGMEGIGGALTAVPGLRMAENS
ncbi:MAG TPA: hypothetical protein VGE30_02280 [Candidatus Saccharimonadales bacterium]